MLVHDLEDQADLVKQESSIVPDDWYGLVIEREVNRDPASTAPPDVHMWRRMLSRGREDPEGERTNAQHRRHEG